jgi:hypothetical protein
MHPILLNCIVNQTHETFSRFVEKWFQNLQSGSKSRRSEGFKHRNIFNISSIESLGPTQELGLRGGFETTSTLN